MTKAEITIGKRITALMKKRSISQPALAEKLGVKQASVWAWLVDRSKPKDIIGLAKVLGTTPEWILHGKGDPESKNIGQYQDFNGQALSDIAAGVIEFMKKRSGLSADAAGRLIALLYEELVVKGGLDNLTERDINIALTTAMSHASSKAIHIKN